MNDSVTVITVCYNAENTIENTIKSVLNQSYRPLEFIIVDGLSTDFTMQIVESYIKKFRLVGINFKYVSEVDNGIYDAMNKGIRYSSGEWINFMNADDSFCNDDVIDKVYNSETDGIDVLYGDEYIVYKDGEKKLNRRGGEISTIMKYLPFCHQSAFTRRKYCEKYYFDTNYNYIADMDFFLKLYFWENARFKHREIPVCNYYRYGQSNQHAVKALLEWTTFRTKYNYPNNKEYFEKIKDIFRILRLMIQTKVGQ